MAGTTTNNSWDYPTSTDLVTNGAFAIETLADEIDTSVGKGLIAWQTFNPTISGTGWVKGSGSVTGRFCKIGKTIHLEYNYTFSTGGGGAAGTGALQFDLPVNAQSTIGPSYAHCVVFDTSAATNYIGVGSIVSTAIVCLTANSSGTWSSLNNVIQGQPITFATGDEIRISATYECV
jgi:hypothetical protein